MGVNAKTAARATEDEHGPEKHKLGTPGLTLRLWSLTARARAMRTEIGHPNDGYFIHNGGVYHL